MTRIVPKIESDIFDSKAFYDLLLLGSSPPVELFNTKISIWIKEQQ